MALEHSRGERRHSHPSFALPGQSRRGASRNDAHDLHGIPPTPLWTVGYVRRTRHAHRDLTPRVGARTVNFEKHAPRGEDRVRPLPDSLFWNETRGPSRWTSARFIIFLPSTGSLVPAVLTAEPHAIYRGCRPAHPGRSGVVDACYMDIKNHTVDDGARAVDFKMLTPRGEARTHLPPRLALLRGVSEHPRVNSGTATHLLALQGQSLRRGSTRHRQRSTRN